MRVSSTQTSHSPFRKRWHAGEFEQHLSMDDIQASESFLGGFYKVQLKYCLCHHFDRASGAQCDSLAG